MSATCKSSVLLGVIYCNTCMHSDESSILNWVKTQSSNVDGYMKSNIDEHIHDNEYIGALEVAEKVMFDDDDDDDCDDSCLL